MEGRVDGRREGNGSVAEYEWRVRNGRRGGKERRREQGNHIMTGCKSCFLLRGGNKGADGGGERGIL